MCCSDGWVRSVLTWRHLPLWLAQGGGVLGVIGRGGARTAHAVVPENGEERLQGPPGIRVPGPPHHARFVLSLSSSPERLGEVRSAWTAALEERPLQSGPGGFPKDVAVFLQEWKAFVENRLLLP